MPRSTALEPSCLVVIPNKVRTKLETRAKSEKGLNIQATDIDVKDKLSLFIYSNMRAVWNTSKTLDSDEFTDKFTVLSIVKDEFKACDCKNIPCNEIKLADKKVYEINKVFLATEIKTAFTFFSSREEEKNRTEESKRSLSL